MSEKRFWINKSRLVNDGWVIDDLKREFTFPVVVGDKTALYSYCKALNKLFNENEQLKYRIQKYYDTTNDDGKQILSDLVDLFELDKIDTSWFDKGDVE